LKKLLPIYLSNQFLLTKSIKLSLLLLTTLGFSIYFPHNNYALANNEAITQIIAQNPNPIDQPLRLNKIGCPDCADGGGEWIEISNRHTSKKIVFEYNQSVPEINSLVTKLRRLRNKVASTQQ
jgi:hypothetical protein